MNRRSNKILRELILGNELTVAELVQRYSVQERTIRADIRDLNDALEEYGLPSINQGQNGEIFVNADKKADIRAYEEFICSHTFYSYYLSKNERMTVLSMILLNANGYVTVEKLGETIGVSRNTLLRDLQELKKWFEENRMELISQVRRGYIVNASEPEIRRGILKLLEVNGDDNDYETGYQLGAFWNLLFRQMDKMNVYSSMKQYIVCQEEEMQSFLSDYSYYEAAMELTLLVNRISNHQELSEYHPEGNENLENSSKYEFSSALFEKIEEQYQISVPETEILYYTECLKGKSYLKDKNHKGNSLDIRLVIAETLYQISRCFGIDFYLDFSLYDLLIAHMRSAVHRLQTGEVLKNPLKDSLLREYPEIFRIIRENIGTLEEYIDREFSEDEMSFMVLYFASVLERDRVENSKSQKVRVALVCETGRGTVQFMLAKLHALDEAIEVVNISSVHNAGELKKTNAQMIVSTIALENTELPCVTVRSAMLNADDLLDIQRMVFEILEDSEKAEADVPLDIINPMESEIQGAFYRLLSEERIQVDYEAHDWEAAVRQSGQLLYKSGAVEKRYIDAMVENIKKNGPYIVIWPGTALPHADNTEGVKKEAASLLRLRTPVDFHNETNDPVRYVIGMSIQSAESINPALYDVMIIFGNEKTKEMLDRMPDERALLQAINGLRTVKK